jgi:hypothetical protein
VSVSLNRRFIHVHGRMKSIPGHRTWLQDVLTKIGSHRSVCRTRAIGSHTGRIAGPCCAGEKKEHWVCQLRFWLASMFPGCFSNHHHSGSDEANPVSGIPKLPERQSVPVWKDFLWSWAPWWSFLPTPNRLYHWNRNASPWFRKRRSHSWE